MQHSKTTRPTIAARGQCWQIGDVKGRHRVETVTTTKVVAAKRDYAKRHGIPESCVWSEAARG